MGKCPNRRVKKPGNWSANGSNRIACERLLGVETAMAAYARERDGDVDSGRITGLVRPRLRALPRPRRHRERPPAHGAAAVRRLDWPPELIEAVAGHATFLGVPRETEMAKTLFAVDELSGFIAACALIRPTGIEGMKPKSVKKKLKQPSFAAGVNRDEVEQGAAELGVDFDEHVAFVITAMSELGLAPREPDQG